MNVARFHIIIDLKDIDTSVLNDRLGLEKFLKTLPGKIDMHVLAGPLIAQGIPENPGLSGIVVIDYSHISVHTFTEYGEALVDIFSCKIYKQEDAVQATLEYFNVSRDKARIKEVFWS